MQISILLCRYLWYKENIRGNHQKIVGKSKSQIWDEGWMNKLHQYSIVFSILGILLQRLRNSLSLSANSNSNSRHLFIYISRGYRHVSWLEDDGMESPLSIFHFTKQRWKVSESAFSISYQTRKYPQ